MRTITLVTESLTRAVPGMFNDGHNEESKEYFSKESDESTKFCDNVSKIEESSWWEEEAAKRDIPLTCALDGRLHEMIKGCPGVFLSHCPDLTRRIAEEIARISREEPGGINACNTFVKVVQDERYIPADPTIKNELELLAIGSLDMSAGPVIPSLECHVYLFPSSSLLSRLQSITYTLKRRKEKRSALKNISLSTDFVIVKKKLFRSRSNSIEVIRSTKH